jgi:hypothetical protein
VSSAQNSPPRARNGRFVKRKRTKASSAPAAQGADSGTTPDPGTRAAAPARHEGSVQLAVLTVAIVLAVLGFALHFLWIAALVVMAVLWGVQIAERQQRRGTVKGLGAELVSTVVDEARGMVDAASGSDPDAGVAPAPALHAVDEAPPRPKG